MSGYLLAASNGDEPSQSHGWVEAFSPNAGWLAIDPTYDRVPDEDAQRPQQE